MKLIAVCCVALLGLLSPATAGDIGFRLSPNPANDKVNILLPATAQSTMRVEVYSVLGNRLFDKEIPANMGGTYSIDCSRFAEGMYLIKVSTATSASVKRLKVQH
jgi:hypothetical protein